MPPPLPLSTAQMPTLACCPPAGWKALPQEATGALGILSRLTGVERLKLSYRPARWSLEARTPESPLHPAARDLARHPSLGAEVPR